MRYENIIFPKTTEEKLFKIIKNLIKEIDLTLEKEYVDINKIEAYLTQVETTIKLLNSLQINSDENEKEGKLKHHY